MSRSSRQKNGGRKIGSLRYLCYLLFKNPSVFTLGQDFLFVTPLKEFCSLRRSFKATTEDTDHTEKMVTVLNSWRSIFMSVSVYFVYSVVDPNPFWLRLCCTRRLPFRHTGNGCTLTFAKVATGRKEGGSSFQRLDWMPTNHTNHRNAFVGRAGLPMGRPQH